MNNNLNNPFLFTALNIQLAVDEETYLINWLKEKFPNTNWDTGAVRDLLVKPLGWGTAHVIHILRKYLETFDLQRILTNPEQFDERVIEYFLSNFRVFRNPGSKATGKIVLIYPNNNINFQVLNSDVVSIFLESNVLRYNPINNGIVGVDFQLEAIGNNRFAVLIPVIAVEVGNKYNIQTNINVTVPSNWEQPLEAKTATEFIGGSDPESIRSAINRIYEGISGKGWHNLAGLKSILRTEANLPDLIDVQVNGWNSANPPKRSKKGTFRLAQPNFVDIWYKIPGGLQEVSTNVTFTLTEVQQNPQVLKWIGTIPGPVWEGGYRIKEIKYGSVINSDLYTVETSLDTTSNYGFQVPVLSAEDKSFHPFQKLTITLENTGSYASNVVGSTKIFNVTFYKYRNILECNKVLRQISDPIFGLDVLVKAPAILFIDDLRLNIRLMPGTQFNIITLTNYLTKYFNDLGFINRITEAQLATALTNFYGSSLISADLLHIGGTYWLPDFTISSITGTNTLELINYPQFDIYPHTTAIYAKPDNWIIQIV